MYTISWFEEDIEAKTKLHAYLSITDELKPTSVVILLNSGLLRRPGFPNCWILLSSVRVCVTAERSLTV